MSDLDRLIRLRLQIERILNQVESTQSIIGKHEDMGFSEEEKKAWLANEPDFPKRIVTPMRNSKPNEDETLPYVR